MTFVRSRAMRLTAIAGAMALTAGAFAGTAALAQDDIELDGEGVVMELIVKENINPFWVWMIDGAEARAAELGVTDFNACWGVEDPDPEGQTECIENALARGATTILIAPASAGVTPALDLARENGAVVIGLDTAPEPPEAADITFATDNFEAGLLIGQWAKETLGDAAADAKIGFINISPAQPVVGVKRNQGFMQGFGIDVGDITMWGDEDDPRIVGQEVGNGNQENSVTAMELLLQANPDINVLYTINEPTARGAVQALEAAGRSADDVLIVSVDGGCQAMEDIEDGIINATSQQYPSRMASLGVDWAVRNAMTGEVPTPEDSPYFTEGLDIFNTGATLITNDPVEGVDSLDTTEGREICWGNFRGEG